MKKLISILAIVLVLAFCAASAETAKLTSECSFRGGVKFGMTQEEVKAIEKETLREQSFGEKQNKHVTILTTDTIKMDGHDATLQYLFWDGKMYTVLVSFTDADYYNSQLVSNTATFGNPTITEADGTANFAESVSGNRPTMIGNQYRWAWDTKFSLTMAQSSGSYVIFYMDEN